MLYISALVLFFMIHTLPFKPNLRQKLTKRMGEKPYKLVFRIIVVSIIFLGITGWSQFENIYFYEPSLLLKRIHLVLMFPVVYLWVIAEVPNNLKRFIRHPMLTGMKLWALGHLLANGDLRSIILFISIFIFAVLAVIARNRQSAPIERPTTPIKYDLAVFAGAVTLYYVLVIFHDNLFGMPVKPYFPF
tara:strand:+ start:1723 stop:2289 length:567 start_codon:yes stop_codon:yes gene_type:complete